MPEMAFNFLLYDAGLFIGNEFGIQGLMPRAGLLVDGVMRGIGRILAAQVSRYVRQIGNEAQAVERQQGRAPTGRFKDFRSSDGDAEDIGHDLSPGRVMDKLTPRERDVVRMRFGLDDGYAHTLEEVGQRFAVTRERVRQIELRALKKLRRMGPVDIRA